jgi:hypothetical protein
MVTKPPQPALKTLLPDLAEALGRTVPQLYERQRELVSAGLLTARPGKGPGSGVPATAHNVALLLVAMLAVERGSAAKRTKLLASAKGTAGEGPYIPSITFLEALASILRMEAPEDNAALARRPLEVVVSRDTLHAWIEWPSRQTNSALPHEFTPSGKRMPIRALKSQTSLSGGFFLLFTRLLQSKNRQLL